MADTKPFSFATEKENQHDRRNQHVHPEKSPNAVGKKLPQEQTHRHTMLGNDPRHKLRVRQRYAKDTKQQVDGFAFHKNLFRFVRRAENSETSMPLIVQDSGVKL